MSQTIQANDPAEGLACDFAEQIKGFPSIDKAAAAHPVCMSCGRVLTPVTRLVTAKQLKTNPSIIEGAIAVTRLTRTGAAYLWYGVYQGFGADDWGTPLFCRRQCAVNFATAAFRAGVRAQAAGQKLTRSRLSP